MGSYELAERSRRVLATLVREYIETAEPVPSQTVARKSGLGVSPATIRNILASLEEEGYLHQPHTSAGRVPTDRGYRVFVDLLLENRKRARPAAEVEYRLRAEAERAALLDDVLAGVSHVVSRTAGHVGFAFCGRRAALLQRLEFVALGGSRVLVVVVSQGNQISQKMVDAGEDVSPDDLVKAANYLNTELAGLPLEQIRAAVLERLEEERVLYDHLLIRALRLASSTFEEMPEQALHVEGAASLLTVPVQEGVSLATLRALFEMMDEKQRLLRLLNQYIDGPGLTIVIGAEHLAPDLRQFSLVASTTMDAASMRTVGVLGPTRMRYSRAIALVDAAAQAVSRVLREAH
jgi:heat-inducible transcriptional repressor